MRNQGKSVVLLLLGAIVMMGVTSTRSEDQRGLIELAKETEERLIRAEEEIVALKAALAEATQRIQRLDGLLATLPELERRVAKLESGDFTKGSAGNAIAKFRQYKDPKHVSLVIGNTNGNAPWIRALPSSDVTNPISVSTFSIGVHGNPEAIRIFRDGTVKINGESFPAE